jgi:gamma-glutamyl-gamma-aminobutyraldehyde dehydrogenase/4-guanidinobutyraldehyde dehydrogenase/NAD-dependent aldehyde dehydrogenase
VTTYEQWRDRAAGLAARTGLFIDGAFAPAADGATFTTVSPRDGSELANVSAAATADVDRAVRAARTAFEDGRWAGTSPRHRKDVLLRLSTLIRENLEELALLETLDVGKPIGESLRVDVPSAANCLQWYAEAIDKTYDEIAPTGPGALALVTREPLGVVGVVVPWNYPLIISSWKIAPALAMGNSVVLKPAEQSSLSALLLAELAAEAGIPDGVFNVVPGLGPVAGEALGRHPEVDKIAFTGSTETGRRFLEYAAQSNGKQVALELRERRHLPNGIVPEQFRGSGDVGVLERGRVPIEQCAPPWVGGFGEMVFGGCDLGDLRSSPLQRAVDRSGCHLE